MHFGKYSPEERDAIMQDGLKYRRGLLAARRTRAAQEEAKAYQRRSAIVQMFTNQPELHLYPPYSPSTKSTVCGQLRRLGFSCSKRTLVRDYTALGGAKFLRDLVPRGRRGIKNSSYL
jgi:hypothetical protein